MTPFLQNKKYTCLFAYMAKILKDRHFTREISKHLIIFPIIFHIYTHELKHDFQLFYNYDALLV